MYPSTHEIEEVGNAFIIISHHIYTAEQLKYFNRYLRNYAKALHSTEVQQLFESHVEIMHAIKVLHDFSHRFQKEKEIFSEFKAEMDELLITLNGSNDVIMI